MVSPASTVAAGGAAAVLALGDLDAQGVAAEVLAVQLGDHRFRHLLVVHVGEAEAAAGAGLAVVDGLEAHAFADAGEQSVELLRIKALAQVAHIKTNAHGKSGRGEGKSVLA